MDFREENIFVIFTLFNEGNANDTKVIKKDSQNGQILVIIITFSLK